MRDRTELPSFPPGRPLHAGLAEWSIPRERWDAFISKWSGRTVRIGFWVAFAVLVAMGIGLPALLIFMGVPLGLGLVLLVFCGAFALLFGCILYSAFRGTFLWAERAPSIWEAHGCVCPKCFAPLTRYVDDRDNCGHGYILEDQPLVVRYLESLATASFGELSRGAGSETLTALRARAEMRRAVPQGGLRAVYAAMHRGWERWFGFDRPLWRRITAHVAVIAAVGAVMWPIAGIYAVIFVWCAAFFLIGSRALARARSLRARGERAATAHEVLGGVCLFLATVAPTTIAPVIGRNLPTEMLFAIGEKLPQATEGTFDVLASRPLSAQDQQRLCDAMLPFIAEWARGGGTIDRSRHAQHILACLANGSLPAANYPRLAQAIAFIDVVVDGRSLGSDESIVEIVSGTRPEIALTIGGRTRSVLPDGRGVAILSSIEVDGVIAWSPSAGADATAPLFGLADTGTAGDRSMVVRGWLAILPAATPASTVSGVGVDGKPVLPSGSAGPWPIDRTLTLRVR